MKILDEEMFCRDWLTEEWYQVTKNGMAEHEITFDYEEVKVADPESETICKAAISSYVDWLFNEFTKWSKDWSTSVIRKSMNDNHE